MGHVNLYLLVFTEQNIIKIGQAVDVFARSKAFDWIGTPDYSKSYYLPVSAERISHVERGLHNLLSGFRVEGLDRKGDGYTELFEQAALKLALQFIEVLAKDDVSIGQVFEGVAVPVALSSFEPKTRVNKFTRACKKLSLEVRQHHKWNLEATENFNFINRVIVFLYRFQHKIPFQYEMEKNGLSFTICKKYMPSFASEKSARLSRRFDFKAGRCGFVVLPSVIDLGDNFMLLKIVLNPNQLRYFPHQAEHSLYLLSKLPVVSPAMSNFIASNAN